LRNSKLMLVVTRASPGHDTQQLYAHCVCVVGKNYRLQNIQLSKNGCAALQRSQKSGGEYRSRTGDLLVANQALSQLS
jgi:hypothetical protein